MFGLGKKASKDGAPPAPPKEKASKSNKSSDSKFDIKDLALKHGEKVVVAIIGVATAYFLYSGTQVESIDNSRTTEDLLQKAASTRTVVATPHWEQIAPTRQAEANFSEKSARSREATEASPYGDLVWEHVARNKGGKRGDPELLAPLELKAAAFMGAIAVNSNRLAPIDSLPNAGKLDEKRGRRTADETAAEVVRKMASGYDFGYQVETTTAAAAETTTRRTSDVEVVVPKYTTFAAVTAAVPHGDLVKNYLAQFEGATGFNADRDSPNYLGFEVQRVDLTQKADKSVIDETDWQSMPNINIDAYEKVVEKWPGTADETAKTNYVADKLTMDVPPILIENYSTLVDHPKIPQISKKPAAASMGYGGGYGAGYGASSETGYGAGYGQSNYGAGYGKSSPSGYGAANAEVEEIDQSTMPKALEKTDFKLLRFFDFEVQPGHTYAYRVRLILEDPNYPRNVTVQPETSTMTPDAYQRVQELRRVDEEKANGAKKYDRTSKRLSPWSETSEYVSIPSVSRLFAGPAARTFFPVALKDKTIEKEALLSEPLVYGEWNRELGTLVPKTEEVKFRGFVLGGKPRTDTGLDIIDPVSKSVKSLPNPQFTNSLTVADINGGRPLDLSTRDNELKSQTEVVAFDPLSGDLVISREFDDFANYRLFSFSDERDEIKKKEDEAKK